MDSMKFWKEMYDDFILYTRYSEDEIATWYRSGRYEITVKFKDGRIIIWDYETKTRKYIHSEEQSFNNEEEWRKIFSSNLKKAMNDRYITQLELSERTGISIQSLSKYINEKATPSAYNIELIANALGCSTSELYHQIY